MTIAAPKKLAQRLAKEEDGFTLIELLTVLIIIGILAAIAVPAYVSFETKAHDKTAQSNVSSALPATIQYYAQNNNSYNGMTGAALRALSPGIAGSVQSGWASGGASFCIQDTESGSVEAYPGGTGGTDALTPALCNAAYSVT